MRIKNISSSTINLPRLVRDEDRILRDLTIAPDAEADIFNEDAELSSELRTMIDAGKIIALSSTEPSSGDSNADSGSADATQALADAAAAQVTADDALPKAGGTLSGSISMGSNLITNVTDPTSNQDAATKAYVDAGGGGGGAWEVVVRQSLTGTTPGVVTGLNLDADLIYKVFIRVEDAAGTSSQIRLYFNGDTNDANYTYSTAGGFIWDLATGARFATGDSGGGPLMGTWEDAYTSEGYIIKSAGPAGAAQVSGTFTATGHGAAVGYHYPHVRVSHKTLGLALTSLQVQPNGAARTFGAGSEIIVMKLA